ncbi:hypothetical protein H5410_051997, partial [Solanum commersonii]
RNAADNAKGMIREAIIENFDIQTKTFLIAIKDKYHSQSKLNFKFSSTIISRAISVSYSNHYFPIKSHILHLQVRFFLWAIVPLVLFSYRVFLLCVTMVVPNAKRYEE